MCRKYGVLLEDEVFLNTKGKINDEELGLLAYIGDSTNE